MYGYPRPRSNGAVGVLSALLGLYGGIRQGQAEKDQREREQRKEEGAQTAGFLTQVAGQYENPVAMLPAITEARKTGKLTSLLGPVAAPQVNTAPLTTPAAQVGLPLGMELPQASTAPTYQGRELRLPSGLGQRLSDVALDREREQLAEQRAYNTSQQADARAYAATQKADERAYEDRIRAEGNQRTDRGNRVGFLRGLLSTTAGRYENPAAFIPQADALERTGELPLTQPRVAKPVDTGWLNTSEPFLANFLAPQLEADRSIDRTISRGGEVPIPEAAGRTTDEINHEQAKELLGIQLDAKEAQAAQRAQAAANAAGLKQDTAEFNAYASTYEQEMAAHGNPLRAAQVAAGAVASARSALGALRKGEAFPDFAAALPRGLGDRETRGEAATRLQGQGLDQRSQQADRAFGLAQGGLRLRELLAGETQRHNQVMEGQGNQRIGISRQGISYRLTPGQKASAGLLKSQIEAAQGMLQRLDIAILTNDDEDVKTKYGTRAAEVQADLNELLKQYAQVTSGAGTGGAGTTPKWTRANEDLLVTKIKRFGEVNGRPPTGAEKSQIKQLIIEGKLR